ncbi:MAG: regulatory protein RecX [Candidatus Lustribacter sp.]
MAALALLAQRRLTEAQLWKKLAARGYEHDEIAAAVAACKADGYIDDRLYAALYVEGARKAVGDARLCADLVKRGIDREAALGVVADAEVDEAARIEAAYGKIRRVSPQLAYPSIARKLERLGFPSSLIYRTLRRHAVDELGSVIPQEWSESDASGFLRLRSG